MSIVVTWNDFQQQDLDKVEVWRADTKAGVFAKVGEVITESTYTDDTVERNRVYWYRLRAVKGADTSDSVVFPLGYFPTTGPGPTELLRGTWEFGYFGEVLPADVATVPDVLAATGTAAGSGAAYVMMYKWIVNGRIIFIPSTPYNAGTTSIHVTGAPKLLWDPVSGAPITTITKGDHTFGIRCLYGTTQNPTQYNPLTANDYTKAQYSELAAFLSMSTTGGSALGDKYLDLTYANQSYILLSTLSAANTPWYCSIGGTSITLTSAPISGAAWPIFELILD